MYVYIKIILRFKSVYHGSYTYKINVARPPIAGGRERERDLRVYIVVHTHTKLIS